MKLICLIKPLVCNLRKKSEDQILDRIIENLPKDNDKYYIEHNEYLNMFMITQDLNQVKKDDLFNLILNLDKKRQRTTET